MTGEPVQAAVTPKTPPKKKAKRRRKKRGSSKAISPSGERVSGAHAPFPKTPFEAALTLGEAIQRHGAGQRMRRVTLFEKLDKSPDSGPSRMMVTNSSKYGITTGGYQAEFLELTAQGQIATNPDSAAKAKLKARFDLAIAGIQAFKHLYDANRGRRLPSPEVMRDSLSDAGVAEPYQREAVDLFLENVKFLGLLRTSAGAERLAPV